MPGEPDVTYGPDCDAPVHRAAMVQWWDQLTFLHWRFDPEVVQRLLPRRLTVETFDGAAWVGLVPFFLRVGLPRTGSVPWMSRFPETNVRTYVRSEDGTSGVWFFSLDAARLGAVIVARTTYRLPYFWSKMSVEHSGSTIAYQSERRWPKPPGHMSAVIEIGDRYQAAELTELDHYLTARWALFSAPRTGLRHALASHDPWRACRLAARLGGDSDTIAAMTGAVVGACCGLSAFPDDAVRMVRDVNDLQLESIVDDLLALRSKAGR